MNADLPNHLRRLMEQAQNEEQARQIAHFALTLAAMRTEHDQHADPMEFLDQCGFRVLEALTFE